MRTLNKTNNFDRENVTEQMKSYIDNIKQGGYEIATKWEEVEQLLEIFPDNEGWEINQLSNGMFAILPTVSTRVSRKEYEQLLESDK